LNPLSAEKASQTAPRHESASLDFLFRTPARDADPTTARLADLEEERQLRKLILIASESVCPAPVRELLGSAFNNLYTEGYPSWRMTEGENRQWADFVTHLSYFRRYSDSRYYRGCDYANFVETIAQKRIKELFATDRVPADQIFANVQPLSGAAANNAVYLGLIPHGSQVVGMSLVEGGHLTHGSPANRSGKSYAIHSYGISPKTGRIDYEQIEALVREHKPRMLIGGASAYPWHIDWARLRAIADLVPGGCYLLADVAHYAGLIVARQYPNPIEHAHVVTFTTHKSMCGPRGACILTTDRAIAQRMNVAVFPGEQGGPHQQTIAAKAVAFHLAGTETFRTLMAGVVKNAKALAKAIDDRGVKIAYGGTDSHLCLVDLSSLDSPSGMKLTGEIASRVLDLAGVVVNKNTMRGDRSAVHPSAIRLGTVWLSQLGYDEADMDTLGGLIVDVVKNVHPFRYLEGNGYVGRGKIDLDLLDAARRGIDRLIESRIGPPTGSISGYPHYDGYADDAVAAAPAAAKGKSAAAIDGTVVVADPGLALLEVESERAHYFLQSAGTADVSQLAPGDSMRTIFLDRHGKRIDDALIVRRADRVPGWKRYLLVTDRRNHARLRRWLRALSDGYVLFDEQDAFRKVEGPAMIEDLTFAEPHEAKVPEFALHSICEGTPLRESPAQRYAVLAVVGKEGAAALAKAGATIGSESSVEARIGGIDCIAVRDEEGAHLVIAPLEAREKVAGALSQAAKVEGAGALAAWRAARKLPAVEATDEAAKLHAARPDLFGATKVYYVGQSRVPAPQDDAAMGREYSYVPAELPLRKTPLHDEHVRLGNKDFMVPFGGWRMPVRYGSILEEHQVVRTAAGLFDVAHMGVLEVRGRHAQRFLDAITTNYVAWLQDGQSQYAYLLDPNGKCIDDILVYRRAWDRILVVVNASNAEKDEAWIRAAATGEFFLDRDRRWIKAEGPVEIVNLKDPAMGREQLVDLALQGPRSFDVLGAAAANPAMIRALRLKKRFEFVEGEIAGIPAIVSTTGYTGESEGFEILVHPDRLVELWNLLLDKGEPFGAKPCGLGARDSTRIEAGFPLWGHELAGPYDVTPLEAGYGSAVKLHKPFFVGRDAMRRHDETRGREIVRFTIEGKGKRLVRDGNPIVDSDGKWIGVVTSNTQVTPEQQIGLALVDKRAAVRGKTIYLYRLPPADRVPPGKRMSDLGKGDSVLLPDEARIIRRFL
jgi:glycine cleavage system T protein